MPLACQKRLCALTKRSYGAVTKIVKRMWRPSGVIA